MGDSEEPKKSLSTGKEQEEKQRGGREKSPAVGTRFCFGSRRRKGNEEGKTGPSPNGLPQRASHNGRGKRKTGEARSGDQRAACCDVGTRDHPETGGWPTLSKIHPGLEEGRLNKTLLKYKIDPHLFKGENMTRKSGEPGRTNQGKGMARGQKGTSAGKFSASNARKRGVGSAGTVFLPWNAQVEPSWEEGEEKDCRSPVSDAGVK